MHELVLVACALSRGDVAGFCAAKDTDCINVGAVTLDLLGGVDGAICHLVLKVAVTRRRAIGEEDDDLLGVGAAKRKLLISQLQAIVGARGTVRTDRVDRAL